MKHLGNEQPNKHQHKAQATFGHVETLTFCRNCCFWRAAGVRSRNIASKSLYSMERRRESTGAGSFAASRIEDAILADSVRTSKPTMFHARLAQSARKLVFRNPPRCDGAALLDLATLLNRQRYKYPETLTLSESISRLLTVSGTACSPGHCPNINNPLLKISTTSMQHHSQSTSISSHNTRVTIKEISELYINQHHMTSCRPFPPFCICFRRGAYAGN